MKIILNNKKIIVDILKTHIKPDEISVRSMIGMMIKLFHEEYLLEKDVEYIERYKENVLNNKSLSAEKRMFGKTFSPRLSDEDKEERDLLINRVKKEIEEFRFSVTEYQEYLYIDYIKNQCKQTIGFNIKLREKDSVKIYKSESDYINKVCSSDNEKKLLFTLFCISKSQFNNGFVNIKYLTDTEWLRMANISGNKEKKLSILGSFDKKMIISVGLKGYNILEYKYIDKDSEIDFEIKEFEMLGNTFLGKYKDGYKMCKCCGKIIKKTSNKVTYCKKCANKKELESKKKWWKNNEKSILLEK